MNLLRDAALALGSAVLTAALVQSKPAPADTLRARSVELVDAKGNVAGEWRTDDRGNAIFVLRNAARETAVHISAEAPGGAVRLYAAEQKDNPSIEMAAATMGGEITTKNRAGAPNARLAPSLRDFGGELILYDTSGAPTVVAGRTIQSVGQLLTLRGGAPVWSSPEK
jgi:hypothetical protein